MYSHVFRLLNEYNVKLDSILLKPNMCLPGALLMPVMSAELVWLSWVPMSFCAVLCHAVISSHMTGHHAFFLHDCGLAGVTLIERGGTWG